MEYRLRSLRRRVDAGLDRVRDIVERIDLETRPVRRERRLSRITQTPEGTRIYAIGDVHGRADLLTALIGLIEADAADEPCDRNMLVFLGDYIDRGFQSKGVLDYLIGSEFDGFDTVFLKGNHEDALQRFLADPSFGAQWAQYGGAETLASYGVHPPTLPGTFKQWRDTHDRFLEVFPDSHRDFLDQLELSRTIGDYVFVHAGLKPGAPIEAQEERDLLWIRDRFLDDKAPFEKLVVHGHTPISAPFRDHRRIGVDTGAYLSGKLTAARLAGEAVSFIST